MHIAAALPISFVKLVIGFFLFFPFSISAQNSNVRWIETTSTIFAGTKTYSCVDLIGNIYIAGSIITTQSDANWTISSFSPDSLLRWTINSGTSSVNDFVRGIAIDSLFNLYIVGDINANGSSDIQLLKMDSAGNELWNTQFSRTGSSIDNSTTLKLAQNKIHVCGNSTNASGIMDYAILQYDANGNLVWSQFYNGVGNNQDYSTGITCNLAGDVFVTGYSKNASNNYDFATIKYNSSGVLQWSKTYGNTSGFDDFSNAISADNNGFLYVTGQSWKTSTNADYTTIKYDNAGNQRWVAKYDGPSQLLDNAMAVIATNTGQIFVSGTSESATGNTDYATICYAANGQINWLQRYNGIGNGNDEFTALQEDGDDIVISGSSKNNASAVDFASLSYKKTNGNVNWTIRQDFGNSSLSDIPFSISTDQMGNVYLSGQTEISSGSKKISLIKINQLEKNEKQIEASLKMLAYSFIPIQTNTNAKNLLYANINLVVDSFYQMRVDRFISKCLDANINVVPTMSLAIANQYMLNPSFNWVEIIEKRIWFQEKRGHPSVYVESFFTFSQNTFSASALEIAYTYFEQDYPFNSVTSSNGFLNKAQATLVPSLNIIFPKPNNWISRTPDILLCTAELAIAGTPCEVCSSQAEGPLAVLPPSAAQNHEIGIKIGADYYTQWTLGNTIGSCITINDANLFDNLLFGSIDGYYAQLRAMPGMPYYKKITSGGDNYARIEKLQYPMKTQYGNISGYCATLCTEFADCKQWGESGGYLELGQGGIYQISRPGVNMQPIYFSFPYSRCLWYTGGPDMNIALGYLYDPYATCTNGNSEIIQDYFIGPCEFCGAGQSTFGMSAALESSILATTDYQTIYSYWTDNAISFGFGTSNSSLTQGGNVYTAYASYNSSNDCTPQNYSNLGSLVGQLTYVASNSSYEVQNNFINDATFASGTNFLVYVRAKYKNGEEINDCYPVTLNPDPYFPNSDFSNISIEIRGDINDYDPNNPTLIFYQVDIYTLN
jgi:hypothetical protein